MWVVVGGCPVTIVVDDLLDLVLCRVSRCWRMTPGARRDRSEASADPRGLPRCATDWPVRRGSGTVSFLAGIVPAGCSASTIKRCLSTQYYADYAGIPPHAGLGRRAPDGMECIVARGKRPVVSARVVDTRRNNPTHNPSRFCACTPCPAALLRMDEGREGDFRPACRVWGGGRESGWTRIKRLERLDFGGCCSTCSTRK